MCGIVGSFSFQNPTFRVTEPYLIRMRDSMAHRGPDGEGVWVAADGRVGLGHRRLAIIDLSPAAAQPMCNVEKTLWVSFNGEIYNHAELRHELERLGVHGWRTDHSDTEVILHAFEQWGIACLEKFRGMFAIALWDARTRELWLIRDRLGIKPLYYSCHHGRLTFASEIKALLQDPEQPRAINEEALYHYLSFLVSPPGSTLFEGIKKVQAGTWLRIKENGQIQEHEYWDVWEHTAPLTDVAEEEIAERVLAELRTAVQYRKVSDVPVGVFLSGGLDSSVNAALFAEGQEESIKTFTIGYAGEYHSYQNEFIYAHQMARTIGADAHERLLTLEDMMSFFPQMVHLQDEPIADPVCIPVYYLSQLARDAGVSVCQVGEGADELFWGYPGWKTLLRLQYYDDFPVPQGVKKAGLAALRWLGREQTTSYEFLRRGVQGLPVFWGGAEAFTEAQKHRVLSPRLRKKFSHMTSWEVLLPFWQRFKDAAWETSPLHWMSYLDLRFRLPELLLMRVDKMSMGVGLEARVPFLDHKLVELALSIPASVKTKHGTLKSILKKAVRGQVPAEIIERKKQGFGVPIHEWFFDQLGAVAHKELSVFCQHTDLLDYTHVTRLIEQGHGTRAWPLLNLALWWKAHFT